MYLNVVQLAESLGVEESVVEGWVRNEGLPSIADRGRLLFDRAQVVSWAAGRGLATRAGFLAQEPPVTRRGGRLELLLRTGGIWREVDRDALLPTLEQVVTRLPGASPPIRQLLVQRLRSPGGVTWAPVGHGLALPHLRSPVALGGQSGILALLALRQPLVLDDPPTDGIPVTRLFFFIASSPRAHLELLALLGKALSQASVRELILHGESEEALLRAFAEADPVDTSTPGGGKGAAA